MLANLDPEHCYTQDEIARPIQINTTSARVDHKILSLNINLYDVFGWQGNFQEEVGMALLRHGLSTQPVLGNHHKDQLGFILGLR